MGNQQKVGHENSPDRPPDDGQPADEDAPAEAEDTSGSTTEGTPPHGQTSQSSDTPTGDERAELDYSPASGATDPADATQDMGADYQTGRHGYTPNATFATEQIGEAKTDGFESLNEVNRHARPLDDESEHPYQRERNHNLANDCRAWGSRVGLTDRECGRAVAILQPTDPDVRNGFGPAIVLAALTLAANEKPYPKVLRSPELAQRLNDDFTDAEHNQSVEIAENFRKLQNNLDVSTTELRSARQRLQKHL